MSTSPIQFISQVKPAELRWQRALLLEAYDRLGRECAAQTPALALKTLFDGLQSIKVVRWQWVVRLPLHVAWIALLVLQAWLSLR